MDYDLQLSLAIDAWNSGDVEDEWQFARVRDECIGTMTSEEAFHKLDSTIEQLTLQESEITATEILETILALVHHSQTTQKPAGLFTHMIKINEQFSRFGPYANEKLQELKKAYRD